jgi:prolyl-tRNA synthetase
MFDDRRDASPGVKFKDAELIGIPYIVVVGKGLADGKIELKIRKSGEKQDIPLLSAVSELQKLIVNS